MSSLSADAGSFRDPGGRVFVGDKSVFRAVYPSSSEDYRAFRDSGLSDRLTEKEWLLASKEIDISTNEAGTGADFLLEHPRLPFVSYPYEWPFSLHKRASLLQLDLLLEALDHGFTMSDASAYNVQFVGCEPRFIDHLSFRPYRDDEIWAAHRQFCMQFLNPIVLWSRFGVAPNSWFRGALEGVAPEDLAPLLRWHDKLSWTLLSHVVLQGVAQKKSVSPAIRPAAVREPTLSRRSFKAMIQGLRSFISNASIPHQRTVWGQYDLDNSYQAEEVAAKHTFVRKMVDAVQPAILFDLGCNTGDYSAAAIEAGAKYVVGFDYDFGALGRAVERSSAQALPFLPLWLDATNPSPSQGWNELERSGFSKRARGDAVLALAFIHHLAVARNIPLDLAVGWIMNVAPIGVIEFPPKSDPMVQQLLSRREDIFANYDERLFVNEVEKRARIVASKRLSDRGRLLVWYDRSERA